MKNIHLLILIISSFLVSQSIVNGQNTIPPPTLDCYQPGANGQTTQMSGLTIPNVELVNQEGKKVNFQQLIKDKVVAINFIFTTCTTVCPPMGANFTNLKHRLSADITADKVVFISISIDPVIDTPERLKNWSEKFKPGQGWTLLTGEKAQVNALLKGLNVFTPLKDDHAPILLIGKEGQDNWIRTNALAPPAQLEKSINHYLQEAKAVPVVLSKKETADKDYFTDVKLVNQHGEEMRLYSDLMKDKVVVINPFFLKCTGACPVMNTMMKDLQVHFADKVGKEVHLISISVDPEYDTPDKVAAYAKAMDAVPGRYFLTGSKENVDKALHKLGNSVTSPMDHKNVLMIGNVSTRLWKKANGLAASAEIIKIVESVVADVE